MNESTTDTPVDASAAVGSTDWGFRLVIGLILCVATWLLLMPWVPAIAMASLHRFHLRSGSFVLWAMQGPVPAMYNFANRYTATRTVDAIASPETWALSRLSDNAVYRRDGDRVIETGIVNHFPVRVITFADGRYRLLVDRVRARLSVQSSYRGQSLTTTYDIQPGPDKTTRMVRIPAQGERP